MIPHMKKITILLFILFGINAQAQEKATKQEENAKKFIEYITNAKTSKAWKLFDQKNNPDVTKEKFSEVVKMLSKDFQDFDKYDLILTGKKFIQGKTLDMYTFQAVSTKKRIITDIQIDVLFFEGSHLIAGFQPKQKIRQTRASTSKAAEIEVEKGFEANIENKKYRIIGINIVPFKGKQGLLVIQIDYNLPDEVDDKKIRKEAVKFAKYLKENNYIPKAKKIAEENGLSLKPELGVSFFHTQKKVGYNVMLEPNEFN